MKLSKADTKKLNSFYAKAGAIIHKYQLIHENDRILVAVSGGKDSMTLLSLLSSRLKLSEKKYYIEAIYIDVSNIKYSVDKSYIKLFCEEKNVKLTIKSISPDFSKAENKSKCFWCSWNKRKAIFEFANEHGFNKIAFGHHLDDAIETLLLNMICHSNISSIPAILEVFEGEVQLIRPLIEFSNKELFEITKILNIKTIEKQCEYEDSTHRNKTAKLIEDIENSYGIPRKSLFFSMQNISEKYLPKKLN